MLTRPLVAVALLLTLGVTAARAADFPLAGSKISLKDGAPSKRKVTFEARFSADLMGMSPNDGSTLRIVGGPGEGDSGLIRLGPNWRTLPKSKGFRYFDQTQSAGGIESILLRRGKSGGRIKIVGGEANWTYQVAVPQTAVTVTLTIGDAKLCAHFAQPKTRRQRVVGSATKALDVCPCEKFDSTWEAIQTVIFARHGCTDQTCHGSVAGAESSGGLNLSPDVAYENLVNVFSELGQMDRVEPGSPTNDSFLYRKLAAKTAGLAGVPGTPMPSGLPALGTDELEALRLWIQYSAKKDGVVPNTEGLLNSCLPPVKPPHLDPPSPPPAGQGVQYYAPPWNIPAHKEDEGCYATYSNLTDADVPPEYQTPCPDFWGGPTKKCYFFNKSELTQEPNSHHSIIHIYRGAYGLDAPGLGHSCNGGGPSFNGKACNPANPGVDAPDGDGCGTGTCKDGFNFRCGGTNDGAACDPRAPDACGPDAKCLGVYKSSLACIDFGPPDFGGAGAALGGASGANAPQVGGSQQPFSRTSFPEGVFGIYPMNAVWVWNSHAFNLLDDPTYNQQWFNIYFAPVDGRKYFIRGVFDADDIFVQDVPAFEEREYCRTMTFGIGTRLFELSSHTHSRGRLFRTWGPGIAPRCRSTKANPGACLAETTPPIAVTTQYNDPTQLRFNPPLALDDPDPAQRTFKFCSIFDNGHTDPSNVKRNSQSPNPPTFGVLAPGGPCLVSAGFVTRDLGISCLNEAKRGTPCEGDADGFQADDRTCDSAPGANDGVCDACPIAGGVTTADEMFIPLGNYYCDPSVPGETCTGGMCSNAAKWGQGCTSNADCGAGGRCESYIN